MQIEPDVAIGCVTLTTPLFGSSANPVKDATVGQIMSDLLIAVGSILQRVPCTLFNAIASLICSNWVFVSKFDGGPPDDKHRLDASGLEM